LLRDPRRHPHYYSVPFVWSISLHSIWWVVGADAVIPFIKNVLPNGYLEEDGYWKHGNHFPVVDKTCCCYKVTMTRR
jgi:hypothetical protein